jgi:hypothetical protein
MTEANQQATANKSQIAEDEQRRNLAARSVGAQECGCGCGLACIQPRSMHEDRQYNELL